jgi:hypothetical protein
MFRQLYDNPRLVICVLCSIPLVIQSLWRIMICLKITDIVKIRIGTNTIVKINVQFNTAIFGFYVVALCLFVECG